MEIIVIATAALFLAYANGSNDNLKGVATLFGSGVTNFKGALVWATVATFFGSLAAIFLSQSLIASFSGKGLLPEDLLLQNSAISAVVGGAATCVLLATRLGMPVSTTHSLIGGLLGVGLIGNTFFGFGGINWAQLGEKFLIPLLISPVLAVGAAWVISIFSKKRRKGPVEVSLMHGGLGVVFTGLPLLSRISSSPKIINSAHYLSAGAVSFARGLNDTPKIAAAFLVGTQLDTSVGLVLVAVLMAAGGWLQGARVVETMGNKVTPINPVEGLRTNLVTAGLVLWASRLGVPVSTTHVSCGSLFGLSVSKKQGNVKKIVQILSAWVLTLPLASLISGVLYIVFWEMSR